MDIKQLVAASGIDVERTATELFGIAVDDFAQGTINPALRGLFGVQDTPTTTPADRNDGSWYATSYAHSLANSYYRPKLKFMFRVEFLFEPNVLAQFGAEAAAWKDKFVFMIKSVDRPKVDFEYEDINQYNFRTKVLKQIKHRALTMTFVDDVGNNVHEFFRFMMMVHSPITRRSIGASHEIADAHATYSAGNGMLFSENPAAVNDFAHRGAIPTEVGNAIRAIKVSQIFVQPGSGQSALDSGAKEVAFFFINPRVESFDLDDVNHETSDANLFTMQFDYDFMVMSDQRNLVKPADGKSLPAVGRGSPSEPTPTGRGGAQGSSGGPDGGGSIYGKILAGIGGRAAQRITSETIGRRIRQIPGAGSVADTLGGLVGGFARDRIGGIVSNVNQAYARPGRDVVSDSTTSGPDRAAYATSVGGFGADQPVPLSSDRG